MKGAAYPVGNVEANTEVDLNLSNDIFQTKLFNPYLGFN